MKKLKWLLVVLILLNIAVFLYLFKPDPAPVKAQQTQTPQQINADWLVYDEPASQESALLAASDVPLMVSDAQSASETNLALSASETEEPQKWCIDTVTLKEEDYTALKNRLNTIGGNVQVKKLETKTQTEVKGEETLSYLVHVPATSDVATQIQLLKDQGFDARQNGGQISLGRFKNASQALEMKQKAFNAGFTQVGISEQTQSAPNKTEEKTVISYQLKFSAMAQDETKQIQDILKNKVKLSTKVCKK